MNNNSKVNQDSNEGEIEHIPENNHTVPLRTALTFCTALTFDTQFFRGKGYNFVKLKKELRRASHKFIFIISIVIKNEMKKHLHKEKQDVKNRINLENRLNLIEQADLEEINTSIEEMREIIERIYPIVEKIDPGKQVDNFFKQLKFINIRYSRCSSKKLFDAYFDFNPPFSKGRREFPDAMALFSLEKWAKEKEIKIIAISGDGEWKNFDKGSDHIYVTDNLDNVLNLITRHPNEIEDWVNNFINGLDDEYFYLLVDIESELDNKLIPKLIEARNKNFYDAGKVVSIKYKESTLLFSNRNITYNSIEYSNTEIEFLVEAKINIYAEAVFRKQDGNSEKYAIDDKEISISLRLILEFKPDGKDNLPPNLEAPPDLERLEVSLSEDESPDIYFSRRVIDLSRGNIKLSREDIKLFQKYD